MACKTKNQNTMKIIKTQEEFDCAEVGLNGVLSNVEIITDGKKFLLVPIGVKTLCRCIINGLVESRHQISIWSSDVRHSSILSGSRISFELTIIHSSRITVKDLSIEESFVYKSIVDAAKLNFRASAASNSAFKNHRVISICDSDHGSCGRMVTAVINYDKSAIIACGCTSADGMDAYDSKLMNMHAAGRDQGFRKSREFIARIMRSLIDFAHK